MLKDTLRACAPGDKGRGAFALSGIRLQQQLPGECANDTI